MLAEHTITYLLKKYTFETVLDIGSGDGKHAELFRKHGKVVTEIDLGQSCYARLRADKQNVILGDYLSIDFGEQKFDAIWASHVLEHQLNINLFLKKIHKDLIEGGVLAITVPPLKNDIVGGHISLWNSGLLVYNLILAGFNCKSARVKKYGYNISVIVRKQSLILPMLSFDSGDIEKLAGFFPGQVHEGFNGDFSDPGWD